MEVTLNRHIKITPVMRGGKPRITGTHIRVADAAIMYLRMGQPLELIAGKYNLPLAAVYTAIAYYYDHKAEIDRQIQEDESFADSFMRNNPSCLQEKLKALRSE